MAKFKYLGPDNARVGRFGKLKHGQVVDLWQSEADYVVSNGSVDWECVDEESNLVGVGTVLPARTQFYDLTRIFWLRETLPSLKRQSRGELLSICRAMRHVGAQIMEEGSLQQQSSEALMQLAYGEAKRLRWDQPDYGPIDHNAKDESDLPVVTKDDDDDDVNGKPMIGPFEINEKVEDLASYTVYRVNNGIVGVKVVTKNGSEIIYGINEGEPETFTDEQVEETKVEEKTEEVVEETPKTVVEDVKDVPAAKDEKPKTHKEIRRMKRG